MVGDSLVLDKKWRMFMDIGKTRVEMCLRSKIGQGGNLGDMKFKTDSK